MNAYDHPVQIDWEGEGVIWKRIIIRPNFDKLEGLLIDPTPSWLGDRLIDLSHHQTIEDAMQALTNEDWQCFTELTDGGEEG